MVKSEEDANLFQLLREFDFTVCDPTNPWKIFNCGIFSQSDFIVKVERK